MKVKLIAIGNRIMGDDGIGIRVAENLKGKFEENGFEVVIGETDVNFCLSRIEERDFLFILDSTYFGTVPGTVSIMPIDKLNLYNDSISQHDMSLLRMLKNYHKNVTGFVIGIEVAKIEFGTDLSSELKNKFDDICGEVYKIISTVAGGENNA